MTIQADDWGTFHYTTRDFTAISKIDHLHKGLGSKSCHFRRIFLLSPGPVYIGFDEGSGG